MQATVLIRTIALSFALTMVLSSCGSGDEKKSPSAGEVVDTYVEKLQTAPGKAREAAKMMEERAKRIDDAR